MANNLDQFPLYDPIVDKEGKLSPTWSSFLATFNENLTGYLSANGIQPPLLTTSQRDDMRNPALGALIYNTTVNAVQYFNGTTWV